MRMATKYYCDFCNKEMPNNFHRLSLLKLNDSEYHSGEVDTKEICEDCFNKYKKEIFKVI